MANAFYTLKFTDPAKASFVVNPLVSNGPVSPNGLALRADALAASTTLQLLGRGHFDYGESVEQNLVYMLENFANASAPSYAIQGQIWYDTSISRPKVWNGSSWDTITVNVAGNIDAGGNRIINLADAIDPTDAVNVEYADARYLRLAGGTVTGAVTFGSTVGVTGAVTTSSSVSIGTNATVGGFLAVAGSASVGSSLTVTTDITGSANVVLNGVNSQITLPNAPLVGTDGANKTYVDTQDAVTLAAAAVSAGNLYVAKAGDTMTGALHITSTGSLQVDGPVTFGPGTVTISAATTLGSTVDITGVTTFNGTLNINNTSIILNGGSTIDANGNFIHNVPSPIFATDAANKAYVDAAVVAGGGGGGTTLTSGDLDSVTGIITLHFGADPDVVITGAAAPFVHTHSASAVDLNVNPAYVNSYLREQAINVPSFTTSGTVPLDIAMQYVDQYLYQLNRGRSREVYVVTGAEAVPGTYNITAPYDVGSNRLAVYLDGIKQIASFHAIGKFSFFSGIHLASNSGLTPSTTYAFNLTVDATTYTNVSITTSSAAVITLNEVTSLIGAALTSLSVPASVTFAVSAIAIGATSSGAGSVVTISSPSAGTNLTTSLANLSAITSSTISTSWAFHEVGAPFTPSNTVTFLTIPAAGQVLEFINEPA